MISRECYQQSMIANLDCLCPANPDHPAWIPMILSAFYPWPQVLLLPSWFKSAYFFGRVEISCFMGQCDFLRHNMWLPVEQRLLYRHPGMCVCCVGFHLLDVYSAFPVSAVLQLGLKDTCFKLSLIMDSYIMVMILFKSKTSCGRFFFKLERCWTR